MSPARKLVGGSESTLGKRKRSVPRNMAAMVALKAIQAEANHDSKKPRRSGPLLVGLAGGAGLAGAGGCAVIPVSGDAPLPGGFGSDIIPPEIDSMACRWSQLPDTF